MLNRFFKLTEKAGRAELARVLLRSSLMLVGWRFATAWAGAVALVVLPAPPARAQSPATAPGAAPSPPTSTPPASEPPAVSASASTPTETLETPYAETAPVVPPVGSQPAADQGLPPRGSAEGTIQLQPALPDIRPSLPIRAQRRLTLTAELGWNGLAGFGPVLSYHAHPRVSLELGGGISLFGWKIGARGRVNLLESPLTPFLGAGFNATSGLGRVTFEPPTDSQGNPERDPVTLDLKDSYLVQGVLGIDYIHRRGFTLVACLGYARLLNGDNVEILAGSFSEEEERGVNAAFKSGPVISIAMGYAFE